MGITYQWQDEGIVVMKVSAPWTWDSYMDAATKMFDEIRRASRPIATIVDVSEVKGLPEGSMLSHLRQVTTMMPDNLDISVIVGAPAIITAFMTVFTKANLKAKRLTAFAATLQEAVRLIAERRSHTA